MEDDFHPCWGTDVDTKHLGDVLVAMGEALRDGDGIGLQHVDFKNHAARDEFAKHELTIGYARGGDTILADPIRYTQNTVDDADE